MSEDAVLLPVAYEVPLIWDDRAHGRERLAADLDHTHARLRVVDPSRLAPTGPNPSSETADRTFEGRVWKPFATARPGGLTLEDFRHMVWKNGISAPSSLSLSLPRSLTKAVGAVRADGGGLDPRVGRNVVERLGEEACARARRTIERDYLYDGRRTFFAIGTMGLTDAQRAVPDAVHTALGSLSIRILEDAAPLVGRHPDIADLCHAVRRIAVRGLVSAIEPEDMADAVRTVGHLIDRAYDETRERRARRNLAGSDEMLRLRVLPVLDAIASREALHDVHDLSDLAP